jgi:hypothetical protein
VRNAAAADEQVSKWKGQNLAVRLAQRSSHLGASVDHFEVTKNQRPESMPGCSVSRQLLSLPHSFYYLGNLDSCAR